MRHLIVLGLALTVAGAASAQTEVIIRRPGEKDQVIRLDETKVGEGVARVNDEIRRVMPLMLKQAELAKVHGEAMQDQIKAVRLSEDAAAMHLGQMAPEMHLKQQLEAAQLEQQAARVQLQAKTALMAPVARAMSSMARLAELRRTPHLGVVLDYGPRDTDKYGAYVTAVTPGSPAERAGIRSGDVITKLAGKSLAVKDRRGDDDESLPGVKLSQVLSQLTPGKTVELELRRGTQLRTVKITPEDDTDAVVALSRNNADRVQLLERTMPGRLAVTPAPDAPAMAIFNGEGFGGSGSFSYSFNSNGMFANLELAPVNEKLGAYFGTSEGVLVVNTGNSRASFMRRAWTDTIRRATPRATTGDGDAVTVEPKGTQIRLGTNLNTLGLEPGDVIVSVDGRKVTTPSQLIRIVATYDHGEEFKLQIMRQKHAETLNTKMP